MEAGKTWKERGNALFQQQKYDEAVDAYTKAIDADNRVAVYYSNRALCHLRLKNYKHVLQDCAKAIERDSISYKAFYYQGQARVGLRDYRLAVESFKKSYDLVPERDSSIALEIWDLIHRASRKQFETAYASQESRRQNAKKGIIEALHTAQARELSEANSTDKKEEIRKNYKFLFDEIEKRFQPLKLTTSMDAPDWACCKISMDYMVNPVMTPSGVSYERNEIMSHFQNGGNFDPINRMPLDSSKLLVNTPLREAISDYLALHPYAHTASIPDTE